MSRYIATRATRGASMLVQEADQMLKKALADRGPDTKVTFPNTAYYLPLILGMTGREVQTLGDLVPVIEHAKRLLHPVPPDRRWTPYLGETLDSGMATLLAEETIEAIRFVYGLEPQRVPGFQLAGGTAFTSPDETGDGQLAGNGHLNGPIDDIQLRSWGIQLVDGRMPGFAAIVGCAKSNEVAVKIVRELQQRNILIFLSGNVNGRSVIHQLQEEGVEMGYDTYIVPFGIDTISAIYALGFAVRSALTFGGLKGGQARDILLYNKERVFAFVLALGEVDDLKYATAAGAINFGFPVVADTVIPQILPTGITTYEHVISMPFDEIEGKDDLERAEKLVRKCIEVRGVKVRVTEVPIPVAYGSAFEGERVRRADMRVEFGGKYSRAFEYLRMVDMDECEDGKIEVIGPGFEEVPAGGSMDLGIVIEVAGRQMQKDFEPVLERQVHYFINAASGLQHIGQRDIAWIRISKTAAEKGFNLEHFGKILHARYHADFGAIVDKVQVRIYTDKTKIEKWLEIARDAYDYRNRRLADLTDDRVDEFYSCTLCLPEGEEILLHDGSFLPVEQLIEQVVEERDLSVLSFGGTDVEARSVGELFINPSPAKLLRITLSNGNTLTLTANHKILVDRPEGLDWVPAREVQVGDYLLEGQPPANASAPGDATSDLYIIDYLPDDYRVSDDAFVLNVLRPAILQKYGTFDQASKALGIPYQRLYLALYEREEFNRQRLALGEVKHIVANLELDWGELKQQVRVFQFGCELKKIVLDEEVMYAAGLVAADGSVRWRGEGDESGVWVQFTNTEAALIDRFCEIHRHLFGASPEVYTTEPGTSTSGDLTIESRRPVSVCYAYNTLLGRLMAGLGIGQLGVEGKWSGEIISTLPPKLIAAFLRGLFDGDGHIAGARTFISTGRYREARHIYLLLKKLGITSHITEITRGYQVVTRSNDDFARFRDLISSEHPQKLRKMEQVVLRYDPQHMVRTDVVPLACGQQLKALLDEYRDHLHITQLPVDYKTIRAWTAGLRRPSKAKLAALLDGLSDVVPPDHSLYQELVNWTKSELRFERVKRIERVGSPDKRVYNFSVEETHNYLVNGVVVKNCQSFAPNHVCIVTPERLGLCGAYNWMDCKASYRINPTGPNQPIVKGRLIDAEKGYWEGPNEFAYQHSNQSVEEVAIYSIMENPMTACLTADAEVLVGGRLMRIGDFVKTWRETRPEVSVLTLDEAGCLTESRLLGVHENPAPEKLVRIVTKSGQELLLTPNHEVAVDRWASNGHGPWIRADQVQVGDRVHALRRLRLEERVPALIDLLPDDVRVGDVDLIAEVADRLRARYGSLSKARQHLGLPPADPRVRSVPLGALRTMVEALDETWDTFKLRIVHVAPPSGRPVLALPSADPDLFYLLGLLASDGSFDRWGHYQCRVNFTNTDASLLEAFAATYGRLFPDVSLGRREKEGGGVVDGRQIASTTPAVDLYGSNFLLGLLADSLGVRMSGDRVWDLSRLIALPEPHIAAFLAGLFDGDGHVRLRDHGDRWPVGEAYLSFGDEQAARHVQVLLKRLGIVGYLRQDRAVWKVELHGSNLRRFAALVPTRHVAKHQILDRIVALAPEGVDKSQEQVLPYAAGRALAELPESRTVLPPSTLFYYQTGRSRPVAGVLEQVIAEVPETAAALAPWLDTDYFLDAVVEVETIDSAGRYEHVYNLSLLDINSYLANGLHVKNCGCFECIAMVIPEANGIMVVSREDPSMTPAGMTFSTLAGMAGGGLQTPGIMGVGKFYLTSPKFISADGGFKRVVWISSFLKESMAEELKQVAEREGDPDLIDKIADERVATTVEELLPYLEEKGHPALTMPPIF